MTFPLCSGGSHTIASLGDVQVHDITFHSELIHGEDAVMMTVYYADAPKG